MLSDGDRKIFGFSHGHTEESARSALLGGAGIAAFMAVATTVLSIVSIVRGSPIMGIDVWSLVDAALIAFLGYKMYSGRTWGQQCPCLCTTLATGCLPSRNTGL